MNKKFIWYILNKIRFALCVPFLMVLGLVTCPFTLLFKWQGISILWIANAESCSLSEAKKILKENVKYPDIGKVYYTYAKPLRMSLSDYNDLRSDRNEVKINSFDDNFYNEITSPSYQHLTHNIYFNS